MIKIGMLDGDKNDTTKKLLKSLIANQSISFCDAFSCPPLDILIINKIPTGTVALPMHLSPKIIIANSDDKHVLRFTSSMEAQIISYGLNPKAAITLSSHADGIYVICIQRAMTSLHNVPIMPREFSVKIERDKSFDYSIMSAIITALICGANFEYGNIT